MLTSDNYFINKHDKKVQLLIISREASFAIFFRFCYQ